MSKRRPDHLCDDSPVATSNEPVLGPVAGAAVQPRKRGRVVLSRRAGDGEPSGVTFNHLDVPAGRSSAVQLSRDRRTLSGHKGYRSVRATRGVNSGTWFFEFAITSHKPGGGVR